LRVVFFGAGALAAGWVRRRRSPLAGAFALSVVRVAAADRRLARRAGGAVGVVGEGVRSPVADCGVAVVSGVRGSSTPSPAFTVAGCGAASACVVDLAAIAAGVWVGLVTACRSSSTSMLGICAPVRPAGACMCTLVIRACPVEVSTVRVVLFPLSSSGVMVMV
jgi:hypothetical protein